MVANDEVANFLVEVADKGDQICVAVPASTLSRQRDEEVGLEGDEIPQMKAEDEISQTKAEIASFEESRSDEKGEPVMNPVDEKVHEDDNENSADV